MNDPKLDSPSFHRNIEPIVSLFRNLLTQQKLRWLEFGSGTGQHVARLSREFPEFEFQPTDVDPENFKSIAAWTDQQSLSNVREPLFLNLLDQKWPPIAGDQFDILSAFNVIHISPWDVTEGLFRAAELLGSEECRVFLYGPFRINGEHTSESNASFEEWLKQKDPAFGVRDIDDVCQVAEQKGYYLSERHTMPANNYMMEFSKGD